MHRAHKVLEGPREHKVVRVILVLREQPDLKVPKDLVVERVTLVLKVLQDQKDLKVHKVLQVISELKVIQVI